MRVDALTLCAVAQELDALITGARVDPVIAPTPHAVALQCYRDGQNRWLLLSAHPQLARVHLLPTKPGKLIAEPSPFVMLLRKYLESGRVDRVHWVRWERIVEIGVRQHDGSRVDLIAEIMGNLSNIILVDDARTILGAIHLIGSSINRYRTILPGQPYAPPPPQTRTLAGVSLPRLAPDTLACADLATAARDMAASDAHLPAQRIILAHIAGASPDLVAEVLCRAGYDAKTIIAPDDEAAWEVIAAITCDLARRAERGEWEPAAILDDEGHVVDGALWPPCVSAKRPQRPMSSVNELLATYFAAREWSDALAGARSGLRRSLKTAQERLQKKLHTLRSELTELAQADRLRVEGELLLAFAGEIPERATSYTPPDFGDGTTPQSISLDPRLTAVENANARFARYHKMRRAAEQIPEQIARAEVDLARVEQLQTDLELAESLAEIAQVRDEITEARVGNLGAEERKPRFGGKAMAKAKGKNKGKDKGGKQQPGGTPLAVKSADGFSIYAGKNSMQNEYVTFGIASGNDLWLHARGVPGAHVIVKSGGRPIPPETLQEAARLAAWYSQSRGASSVPVDYTEQRYVRHMKNGGPGMVVYTHERTLHAVPRDARAANGE